MDRQRPGPRVPGSDAHSQWRRRTLSLITSAALLTGCCGYQARPLDEGALLDRVRAARHAAPPRTGTELTLADATALMRRHNPEIREARAAWMVAESVARVRTPIENPTVGLGPLLYGGSDVLGGDWGVLGLFGWKVPLTGIQKLNDQVNRVRADAALASAAAVERREYLALRADYLNTALTADLQQAWQDLSAVASAAVQTGTDMIEAGQASAVDVSLLRLDAARTEADVFDAAEEAMAERQALAGRMNLHADFVGAPAEALRPTFPEQLPSLDALEQMAVEGNPELARRRAAYVVREKEFRMEVRKQTPDPEIGLAYQQDDLHELGLPLGWELPIFDKNQPGIHRAYAARKEARARYRAELERVFARISAARALVVTRKRTHERYAGRVAPEAKRTLDTTRQALAVGGTDALRYFAVLESTRSAAVDTIRARNELFGAWLELESACGVPLLRFPHSPGETPDLRIVPPAPAANAAPTPKEQD